MCNNFWLFFTMFFNQSHVYELVFFFFLFFFELTLFSLILSCFSFTFLIFSCILSCIFLLLPNNRIIFFMTYFHVNQCLRTKVLMISSLLLANIRILSKFFFLLLVMLCNFLIYPFVREKIKVKLALAIPTGAPTTLAGEMIQTLLLVALKTIKILPM